LNECSAAGFCQFKRQNVRKDNQYVTGGEDYPVRAAGRQRHRRLLDLLKIHIRDNVQNRPSASALETAAISIYRKEIKL